MPRNGSGTYSLYTPGNPVVTGTTISSTWANNTLSDIATGLTNSIAKDGQTTPTANLPMGAFKLTGLGTGSAATDSLNLAQAQSQGYLTLASVTGTDTITASVSPAIAAYASGQTFRFVASNTNTGAATININGVGAKSITKNGTTALAAGDLAANAAYQIYYDGTQFQLANPSTITIPDESITPSKLSDDAFITILGDSKNLIITNNSGTPNSQVDIDADEIILKDSNKRAYLASSVNLTANIAASGANGLDTGSEASSTWYYLWVIYNGTTVASLISASSTAPTLPSGYTYKALVGSIYNDGSSNFIKYYQVGNEFWTDTFTVSSSIPGTSYGSISLAAYVPPNAKSAKLWTEISVASGSTPTFYASPNNSDTLAAIHIHGYGSSSGLSPANFSIPIITAQTIYTKRAGTSPGSYSLKCNGGRY